MHRLEMAMQTTAACNSFALPAQSALVVRRDVGGRYAELRSHLPMSSSPTCMSSTVVVAVRHHVQYDRPVTASSDKLGDSILKEVLLAVRCSVVKLHFYHSPFFSIWRTVSYRILKFLLFGVLHRTKYYNSE